MAPQYPVAPHRPCQTNFFNPDSVEDSHVTITPSKLEIAALAEDGTTSSIGLIWAFKMIVVSRGCSEASADKWHTCIW